MFLDSQPLIGLGTIAFLNECRESYPQLRWEEVQLLVR